MCIQAYKRFDVTTVVFSVTSAMCGHVMAPHCHPKSHLCICRAATKRSLHVLDDLVTNNIAECALLENISMQISYLYIHRKGFYAKCFPANFFTLIGLWSGSITWYASYKVTVLYHLTATPVSTYPSDVQTAISLVCLVSSVTLDYMHMSVVSLQEAIIEIQA